MVAHAYSMLVLRAREVNVPCKIYTCLPDCYLVVTVVRFVLPHIARVHANQKSCVLAGTEQFHLFNPEEMVSDKPSTVLSGVTDIVEKACLGAHLPPWYR